MGFAGKEDLVKSSSGNSISRIMADLLISFHLTLEVPSSKRCISTAKLFLVKMYKGGGERNCGGNTFRLLDNVRAELRSSRKSLQC